jgi:septal ring factor EnvC (AmiA/AmiB activator)
MSEKELQRALHMTEIGIKIFETQLSAVRGRLAEVERQNADLHVANTRLLERARTAENTVVLQIQVDAAKALRESVSVQERLMELEAYREAAIYDEFIYANAVPGPHLGGWNHSKLDRAHKLTEKNRS